jgi:hypothetical protein
MKVWSTMFNGMIAVNTSRASRRYDRQVATHEVHINETDGCKTYSGNDGEADEKVLVLLVLTNHMNKTLSPRVLTQIYLL